MNFISQKIGWQGRGVSSFKNTHSSLRVSLCLKSTCCPRWENTAWFLMLSFLIAQTINGGKRICDSLVNGTLQDSVCSLLVWLMWTTMNSPTLPASPVKGMCSLWMISNLLRRSRTISSHLFAKLPLQVSHGQRRVMTSSEKCLNIGSYPYCVGLSPGHK